MNRISKLFILGISSLIVMGFTNYILKQELVPITLKPAKIDLTDVKFEIPSVLLEINQTDLFLDAIGYYESSNRYDIVNRFGYMGKYQFGKSTLKALGYNVTRKEFLNSPHIQEMAMLDLLSHNKKILQTYIDYWEGKKINGKVITESGILAAAHLGGPGNVKRFLKEGKNFKDGNGTKLTTYLIHFSGYNLNLE
jgi:hypothetical protein